MKRYLIGKLNLLVVLLLISYCAWPQAFEDSRKGRFFLVPEGWLSLGNYTLIQVSPQLGYHLTDRLSIGAGPTYIYSAHKASTYNPRSWRTHLYGGKVFTRFALLTRAENFLPVALFSDLFVHAEYQLLSLEKAYFYAPNFPDDGRFTYQGFLVGPGITQRIGPLSSISFQALWDLNESSRSPFSSPEFRVGFNTFFK